MENLVFQNDVIKSEKGINSLGFGFPILIRKDLDGQISASPILIWPVNIQPQNELNTWGISRTEDDPIYMNEVLINHLQNDSGISLEKIPEEMLADGKIDKQELFSICETLLQQLKISQNIDFLLSNYEEIPLLKSNYNSRLKPLPLKPKQKPIEFFQVDGVFDEHTNQKEAEKVLEILESIEPNSSGVYPSVGIATFNITQRNYIKRQILHKASLPENEVFRNKIQAFEAAGFFIKNLENIQGDERDIIIVSTTYGKKPSGKFIQSFGPVNHTKGYKLLNVIITRAKEKIYICNSIPEEIFSQYKEALQQEGSNNRKAVLYAYLAYCKAVCEENNKARTETLKTLDLFGLAGKSELRLKNESFTNYVFDEVKKGFPEAKILKNYHFGGYEFDILIENKNGKPIVVECMSKEKYTGNLAYIEDLHKEKVIKNAGFEYVRIWSQNSWQNLESEIQNIKNKLCYSSN